MDDAPVPYGEYDKYSFHSLSLIHFCTASTMEQAVVKRAADLVTAVVDLAGNSF